MTVKRKTSGLLLGGLITQIMLNGSHRQLLLELAGMIDCKGESWNVSSKDAALYIVTGTHGRNITY